MKIVELSIQSRLDLLGSLEVFFGSMLRCFGADESEISDINIALVEAFKNAVEFGNRFDEKKSVDISLSIEDDRMVDLCVRDQGCGFCKAVLAGDLTTPESSAKKGRGLIFIKNLMDEVEFFNVKPRGAAVRMRKNLKRGLKEGRKK
jgi:anti-sigma regulatory factor (Ser/Thr protein kinase)